MGNKRGLWVNEHTFVEFNHNTTAPLSQEIASRGRSIDFYNLGMYLPNPDPVLKKMGKDIQVYRELLSDAHVGACVINRKAGVKSLNWSIDRGKARSRQAKIIEDVFKGLDIERITGEILNAPLFGNQPLEVMWEQSGKYWLPKDIVGKPQRWFVYDEDNKPRFLTKTNMTLGEELPEKKFLFPTHDWEYENPYGFALLSRCFWPVTFKRGGYKFWVIFTEKFGMPFLLGKLPRGLEQKEYDDLAETLERMVQDAIAVVPDDGSIEMLTGKDKGGGGGGSADLYEKLLKYGDGEVSKALVGQTLTTEIGSTGSYGASKTHMQVRNEIVWGDKKLVESVFNRLIKWIAEYNFGDGEVPAFSLWAEEDVDKNLADRDKALSFTGQVKFTKKYFMKNYGFEEEDIVVNEEMPEGKNAPIQFAEGDPTLNPPLVKGRKEEGFPDQAALDDAMNSITPEELQGQMQGILKPIIDLINNGKDYNAVMEELLKTFPEMDTSALEEMLARAILVSELWGRLNAEK